MNTDADSRRWTQKNIPDINYEKQNLAVIAPSGYEEFRHYNLTNVRRFKSFTIKSYEFAFICVQTSLPALTKKRIVP
jgi:ribosomal protein L32E